MKEINGNSINVNANSSVDSKLRWLSTTGELVKFQVNKDGTTATVDGKDAILPTVIAVNTSENALYETARTHRLLVDKNKDGVYSISFIGAEFFEKMKKDQLPDHVKQTIPAVMLNSVCATDACGGNACVTDNCGGNACGGNACGGHTCPGLACGAAGCGGHACGADACAAASCPANACGANACALDAGLLPCPAEVCVAHLGIPECPFIL